MKYFANKAFPHPVLSNLSDDYVDRRFQPSLKWQVDGSNLALHVRFDLSEETLHDLIKGKQAAYAVEIHSLQTFRRTVCKSFRDEEKFIFKPGDFVGDVNVNFYIVAVQDVNRFSSPNLHPDFGGHECELRMGDVLAVYPQRSFWFDTEAHKPIGTFFYLDSDKGVSKGRFVVDLEDEGKITILTHPDDYERINFARGQADMKPLLMASLYLPALLEVLHVLHQDMEEYESKKWCRAINQKLALLTPSVILGRKGRQPDLLEAAQKLFGDPLSRLFPAKEDTT